jgi:glycosyltransferase involved in cell wall biosynthesis
MSLAICICTMNRPDELRAALQSLVDGSVLPDQIIVSDDGDGSAEAVAREFESVLYQVGPRQGLGANRNACIAAATTDRIAFIDDDVLVSPEFAERAAAASLTSVTTGWELNHSTDPARKVTPHNASFLGFQRLEPVPVRRSIVINATVFPAALFERALFDERIRYGYEEIDIARHAAHLGWTIEYDDDLHVRHFPSPTNRAGYAGELNVSRLYITRKAYDEYEGSSIKAQVFTAVAAVHHVLYAVKGRHSLRAAVDTVRRSSRMTQERRRERQFTATRGRS